jgi:hypothetical protein
MFQSHLSTSASKKFDRHENILLIVTFSDKQQYHNLPLMEVLYRHHFKNILYCGKPNGSTPLQRHDTKARGSKSFFASLLFGVRYLWTHF